MNKFKKELKKIEKNGKKLREFFAANPTDIPAEIKALQKETANLFKTIYYAKPEYAYYYSTKVCKNSEFKRNDYVDNKINDKIFDNSYTGYINLKFYKKPRKYDVCGEIEKITIFIDGNTDGDTTNVKDAVIKREIRDVYKINIKEEDITTTDLDDVECLFPGRLTREGNGLYTEDGGWDGDLAYVVNEHLDEDDETVYKVHVTGQNLIWTHEKAYTDSDLIAISVNQAARTFVQI